MVKKLFFIHLVCMSLFGMGFAPMGNVSTSLGGAGVALRNSAWGLYYNPALLSSDPRSKFSFSVGLWMSMSDLNPLLEGVQNATPENISSIFASLKNPRATLATQMGVVAQIGGFSRITTTAIADEYGRLISQMTEKQMSAFAIGAFAISQTKVAFKDVGYSNYDAISFGIALMEVPIGYAYKLETSFGDFNFGAALKYMRAAFDDSSYRGHVQNEIQIKLPNFLKAPIAQNFGIDLGFLYSIADVHIGLSAKNINFPTFRSLGKSIKLPMSLRAGVSYEFLKHYAITMDMDLLPQSFSDTLPESQMIAFGVMGDYTFVDFRLGVGLDLADFNETRITAGFNLYGIVDIVGEMGFNFAKSGASKIALPTNFGFKVGSTFTF